MTRPPLQHRPSKDAPPTGTAAVTHAESHADGPRQQQLESITNQLNAAAPVQRLANGLPAPLQAGIEALSGFSMAHVQVHRNSVLPAQMQASAFAQGSHIHLAPGQERHLPHEAWHVVQQAQGRVRPTLNVAGTPVNDQRPLELEADVMGRRALSAGTVQKRGQPSRSTQTPVGDAGIAQRASDYAGLLPNHDVHGDGYRFHQEAEPRRKFTYHHIIPENVLHDVHEKVHAVLEHTPLGHALHAHVATLKTNARAQWLATRVTDTVYFLNKEFRDLGLRFTAAEIRPLLMGHAQADARTAIQALAHEKLMPPLVQRFATQANLLKNGLVALLKTRAFVMAWENRRGDADIQAEVERVNLVIHGCEMYRPAEFIAIFHGISADGPRGHSNKGELVRQLIEHAKARATVNQFYQDCYAAVHGQQGELATLVRNKGLPKEDQNELEDAITWNPGNIHRGPESSLRLSPAAGQEFDAMLDDGGDRFEQAASNLVDAGHHQELTALNQAIGQVTALSEADVAAPTPHTVNAVSTVVQQMVALQARGVTAFNRQRWKSHVQPSTGKRVVRVVGHNEQVAPDQLL